MGKPLAIDDQKTKEIQIIIGLGGGLGNQLYQFALGERLQQQGIEVKYDTSFFDGFRKFRLTYFVDGIDLVDIRDRTIRDRLYLKYRRTKGLCKVLRYVYSRIFNYLLVEKLDSVDERVLHLTHDQYLEGYWGKLAYYEHLKETLQHRISLKEAFYSDSFINYRNQILSSLRPTISVHVRRTDYLNADISKVWNNLSKGSYYEDAIKLIKQKVSNPMFFVFSDDIEWCKTNLKIKDVIYVEPREDMKDYHDFELIRSCSHHINANSTFSWWPAYLNTNPNKVVTVPKVWFLDEKQQKRYEQGYSIPKDWIKV